MVTPKMKSFDIIQPALFISHGTIYEAFKSEQLRKDFLEILYSHISHIPNAIVIFSAHWQTEKISVTLSENDRVLKEFE